MLIYVLDLEGSIKIGMSVNFDRRLKSYRGVTRKETITRKDFTGEEAAYIETQLMAHFNSSSEYLVGADFTEVVQKARSLVEASVVTCAEMTPLDLMLDKYADGYIDAKPAMKLINEMRRRKGKKPITFSSYKATESNKEYLLLMEQELGKPPVLTSRGVKGTTYLTPRVLIDLLTWGDSKLKVKIYLWLFRDPEAFGVFIDWEL